MGKTSKPAESPLATEGAIKKVQSKNCKPTRRGRRTKAKPAKSRAPATIIAKSESEGISSPNDPVCDQNSRSVGDQQQIVCEKNIPSIPEEEEEPMNLNSVENPDQDKCWNNEIEIKQEVDDYGSKPTGNPPGNYSASNNYPSTESLALSSSSPASPMNGSNSCGSNSAATTTATKNNSNCSSAPLTSGSTQQSNRRIFTTDFKLKVLEAFNTDMDCIGNQRATARKFGIHRRQVQKWLQHHSQDIINKVRIIISNLLNQLFKASSYISPQASFN